MPHLPFCDAVAAYIFSWADMNNIFVFSVLLIVLLHMKLCVVFFFFFYVEIAAVMQESSLSSPTLIASWADIQLGRLN